MNAPTVNPAVATILNPGLRFEPHHRGVRVWNPQQRNHLILPIDDLTFLMSYNTGLEVAQESSVDAYMKHQKYSGLGLLRPLHRFSAEDFGAFIFGEHPLESVRFFEKQHGFKQADIRLTDLPHLDYLQRGAPETVDPEDPFIGLLHALVDRPGLTISPQAVLAEVVENRDHFRNLLARYQEPSGAAAMLAEPFQAARRDDGRWVLLAQSGRACVALALGLAVNVVALDPADWLGRVSENDGEFFGSSRGNLPYHSVFHRGELLVKGLRTDLHQRLDLVDDADLVGKRVLDFGSNIGMTCAIACERGAIQAQGLEYSEQLVRSATRLNTWLNHPCCFRTADLNKPVDDLGTFDTAFFFALLGHLAHGDAVVQAIRDCGVKVVYFESHCDAQPQGDMEGFLNNDLFKTVTLVGNTADSTHSGRSTRTFYRLEVGS